MVGGVSVEVLSVVEVNEHKATGAINSQGLVLECTIPRPQ